MVRSKMEKLFFVIGLVGVLGYSVTARAETPPAQLISALIQVESGGNDNAIGDTHLKNKAYGCLQIRQPACDDVNRRHGTNYQATDCLGNRELSVKICRLYIDMYATEKRLNRAPGAADMARIWNGGPNGFNKQSTVAYWEKVRRALETEGARK